VAIVVVGLDLSLTGAGICRITADRDQSPRILLTKVGEKGSKGATWEQRRDRLNRTVFDIVAFCDSVDLAVIEGPAYSSITGHAFDRAGLWWLTYMSLFHKETPIAVVESGRRALYGSGINGRAGKLEVMSRMIRQFPTLPIDSDDKADALVLACMGMRNLGYRIDVATEKGLKAMNGTWPEIPDIWRKW